MPIRDLIRINTNAEFFNDVQLRWFWDEQKNAKLAKGYIFTRQAGENRKSTVDALNMVRYGLTDPGSENRLLFMATFGQGKTHLALAMANFFAKPLESEEVQYLIQSLKNAYGDSPAVKNFTDLKERSPRHIVVCLQGDEVGFDLSSYFVREIERSLKEELRASGGMLPLWFKTALDMLDTSVAAQRSKADAFLATRDMDLPKLRHRLEQKDAGLYDLVRELIEHVTGVRPDLGARLSLNALVSHVCKEYCGKGKPYAGLVVLFDEFNAFMHAYSRRETGETPLQDLLNGIANNREISVFVGFAQRDPMTIVNALQPTNRDALTVEMSRIPQNQRTWLFNNLETVLDAYIGADEEMLRNALEAARAWASLIDAEVAAQILFRRRYERELEWGENEFHANVTIGCFPLHPVTTALLCSVDLAETGNNARGLLQFVLKSMQTIEDKPVATNGKPTWIHAARMVDYFEKTLCVEELHWEQYQKAVYDGGGDLPETQKEVLKAMLLHLLAKLPMANVKYEQAIAFLAGIDHEEAKAALKCMADRNLIDWDATNNKFNFLSASGGDRGLRDYIKVEIEQTQIKLATLQDASTISTTGFRETEVSVEWGNAADWQAKPTLLTKEFFQPEILKRLLSESRGVTVWLIPRDEKDISELEANAQSVVDAACGTTPQPLTILLPTTAFPGIHDGLRRLQLLADLPHQKRVDFAAYIPNTKAKINEQLKVGMRALRESSHKWFAHTSLTPTLQAAGLKGDALIKRVVIDCFKKAPPSFIKDQKEDNPKLRKASALLSKLLLENSAQTLQQLLQAQPNEGNYKMADTILDAILTVGRPSAWGVVSSSKHLQEPTHLKVRLAWDELSKAFPSAGPAGDLDSVIKLLRKPPYGYDSNTFTLLLCAWIGYHRHDLEITQRGAAYSLLRFKEALNSGKPADFIADLSSNFYKIKRRDRTVVLREIEDILSRVQRITANPLGKQEANAAITKLEAFLSDSGNSGQAMRERVEESQDRLKGDLELAETYDTKAEELLTRIGIVTKVNEALSLLGKARELPACSGVRPTQPAVTEIVTRANAALDKTVEDTCHRLSELKSITDFGRQEDELKSCNRALHDKIHLQHKVTDALAALHDAKSRLEAQQSEDATLRTIDALSARVPINELERNLETLNTITIGSEKVTSRLVTKRRELTQQVDALVAFADSLDSRIGAVKDATELRALIRQIDANWASYAGSAANEAKLTNATKRCSDLEAFFAAITPLSQAGLNSPQDLAIVLDECAASRQRFSSSLSQTQLALIDQIESNKKSDFDAKSQAAKRWLQNMEKEWRENGSNPAGFLHKLSGSPPFLSEDAKTGLTALRTTVREKLESNEEDWIVSKFQGILNKVRRQKLVKRLQDLLTTD